MSDAHKEQLEMVFKPNALNEVSQTEIALLSNWIEDILSKMDLEEDSLPSRLMN